jgi:hypothetical protein
MTKAKKKKKKKPPTKPTRIYKYGACAPRDEETRRTVHEILFKASRYYNKLIEIERARYARFVEIRREHAPELAALEDAYSLLDDEALDVTREIKRIRQAHFQKTKGEKTLAVEAAFDARLKVLEADKKRVSAQAKPLREAFKEPLAPFRKRFKEETLARAAAVTKPGGKIAPPVKGRINAIVLAEMVEDPTVDAVWKVIAQSDADAVEAGKRARKTCGLSSGTYQKIEEAVAQAKKASLPRPPRFKSFRGGGRLTVQLVRTTFQSLFDGTNTKLQLVKDVLPGARGKQERYWRAKIRIGSDGRKPVWAEFPVKLHRAPPPDAEVKWAWILARKQGDHVRYTLQLTLQHPAFDKPKRPAGIGDGGHIQLGWAEVRSGVRVAHWPDGQLIVPWSMMRRAAHVDVLKSHADTHTETAKRVIKMTFRQTPFEGVRLDYVKNDRSRNKLKRAIRDFAVYTFGEYPLKDLWLDWKRSKPRDLFASLPEASRWLKIKAQFAHKRLDQQTRLAWWLFTWTKKDDHLRQWKADAEASFSRARDAFFREHAIRLATQYETMTIDDYSIADLKEQPELKRHGDHVLEHVQYNLQHAAPGRFREILLETMGGRCREQSRPPENPDSARGAETPTEPQTAAVGTAPGGAPAPDSEHHSQTAL